MLFDIIQNNYACVIVCLLFMGFVITDKSFESRTEALFLAAISLVLCITIVDSLELAQAELGYPTAARSIYSALGYSLRPATAIIIILIMNRNCPENKLRMPYVILLLPFAVNLICSFASIANGCVFYYTAENAFVRGPLGLLPFITAGFYVICMVVYTLTSLKTRQRAETIIIFMIALMSVGSVAMESVFGFDGVLNTVCALGAVFYYLYLHVSVYSTDFLTRAYSRRMFYLDIEKLGRGAVVVGIDLNDLKYINDFHGHAAGDEALITLARTISKNLKPGCTLYRTGGDEFAILCRHTDLPAAEELLKKIKADFGSTPYSFAYGCAVYHPGKDVDAVCNEADAKMYTMKTNMKASISPEAV